ncbi:MAG: cellulase family glycosylhydrolase [Pricia sp.]
MNKTVWVFLFLTSFLSGQTVEKSSFEKFEVIRGTNIARWLSQSDRRGAEREAFFTEKDIVTIAEMGFDHIRLPLDEKQMWDESGKRHEDAFVLMENAVQWCAKHNLRIIVDLHILRSHHFNEKEKPLWTDSSEQEKFFDLWRDLSKTLRKYPTGLLAYELMNEAVADDPEDWNRLLAEAYSAIREFEPERTIVIGSNRWQSVKTFDVLKVPENDKNILLSFHFYEPFLLTHYTSSWTHLKEYDGPVHYPGTLLTEGEFEEVPENQKSLVKQYVGQHFDKKKILEMWQGPIQKAKKLGLPLYCGEFGVMSYAPKEDRLKWYEDVLALLEKNGIGYANWNYRTDNFGLLDSNGRNEKLIEIVSGK